MSPGSDGPNIQYDNIDQAVAAFGLGKPENIDGTVGRLLKRPHKSVAPKGGFKVPGVTVRGKSPKRRVVQRPAPIVEQEPYDEYEEPLPEYLQEQPEPAVVGGRPVNERYPAMPLIANQNYVEGNVKIHLELEIPLSKLMGVLNASR